MSDQVAVTGSVSTGDGHSLRTGIVSSLILSSGSGSDNTGLDVPVEADLAGAEQVRSSFKELALAAVEIFLTNRFCRSV